MATLRLTYSDIYQAVSKFLGWGKEPVGDQLDTVKSMVLRGCRQFLYPVDVRTREYWEWSFLRPLHSMTLKSNKWRYLLPEDFSSIITNPTYSEDDNFKQIARTTPDNIMNLMAAGEVDYAPYYYAIVTSDYDPEIGEMDEIWFYPKPDSSYSIQFFYKSDPMKVSNDSDFLPGGVKSTEAILENCLAIAEQENDNMLGTHTQLAQKLTQELIIIDSQKDGDDVVLGNLYDSKNAERMPRSDRANLNVYGTDLV
jgi:hypothetical protein